MKLSLTLSILLFAAIPVWSQQALANKPPKAFGPVKTIEYEYYSVTFNREKTRIEQTVPNGRNVVWSFAPQGRLLSREIFEKNGRTSGMKTVYRYDLQDRLTSVIDYWGDGSVNFADTIDYPDEHRVRTKRVFEPKKDTEIEVDEYDAKGNITKATIKNVDGTLIETYKYDENGNPTEFVAVRAGETLIRETYRYEFDSQGNWTTQYEENTSLPQFGIPPKSTISRKITYY